MEKSKDRMLGCNVCSGDSDFYEEMLVKFAKDAEAAAQNRDAVPAEMKGLVYQGDLVSELLREVRWDVEEFEGIIWEMEIEGCKVIS